jgi:exopolyphosphatase/guanosine-5'-triphosphate,3'-diphosphate pyrophosphatase
MSSVQKDAPRRIAVLDIGSASVRLLCVETTGTRTWRVLAENRVMTRLAHGLAETGAIAPEAIARSLDAIAALHRQAEVEGCTIIRAFATAATRDASNGAEFIARVKESVGLEIRVISPVLEGCLVEMGVATAFDLQSGPAAVIDIGGGSCECVQSINGIIWSNESIHLGAVRLTELFGGATRCSGARFEEMRRFIKRTIDDRVPVPPQAPLIVVGCGGTFTTLSIMAAAAKGQFINRNDAGRVQGSAVTREEVRDLLDRLRQLPLEDRLTFPGLPADRADIIVAGLTVVDRLLKQLGATKCHVHARGVRDGQVLLVLDELDVGQKIAPRDGTVRTAPATMSDSETLASVRRFADRVGVERVHCEHVASLAVSIFDQFAASAGAPGSAVVPDLGAFPRERLLLESAAILHDIGCLVEFRRHHKRSRDMILNSGLDAPAVGFSVDPAFSTDELCIVAAVARYHRRAMPDASDTELRTLDALRRAVIDRLAAILRIADSFDRSHRQSVRSVRILADRKTVAFEASLSPHAVDIDDELAAAAEKADLFERVCSGRTLVFSVQGQAVKGRKRAIGSRAKDLLDLPPSSNLSESSTGST